MSHYPISYFLNLSSTHSFTIFFLDFFWPTNAYIWKMWHLSLSLAYLTWWWCPFISISLQMWFHFPLWLKIPNVYTTFSLSRLVPFQAIVNNAAINDGCASILIACLFRMLQECLFAVCMCTICVPSTCRGQKRAVYLKELELWLWTTMWVLGIEFRFSAMASNLNYGASSPAASWVIW